MRLERDLRFCEFGQPETIVACLTMPDLAARSQYWQETGAEDKASTNGLGKPINLGTPPTQKSLDRFQRAMKILDLKAYAHQSLESQECEPLVLGSDGVALEEGPRPMLLLRNQDSRRCTC